jgi:hypothetical protein
MQGGGAGVSKQMSHAAAVNHGNQMNPSHKAFASSRGGGGTSPGAVLGAVVSSQQISHAAALNHGNQMNPSHSAYPSARGGGARPAISEGQFKHHAVPPFFYTP